MLRHQAPVYAVSHENVTVLKVPMDINTSVQDRNEPRSLPIMSVSKDLPKCLLVCLTNTPLMYIIAKVLANAAFTERGNEVCL